jgi:hypothetical protein
VFFAREGFFGLYFGFLAYVKATGFGGLEFVRQWGAASFFLIFAFYGVFGRLGVGGVGAVLRLYASGVAVFLVAVLGAPLYWLASAGYTESWASSSVFWVYPYTISVLSAMYVFAGGGLLYMLGASLFHVGGPVYLAAAFLLRWVYGRGVGLREAVLAGVSSAVGFLLNLGSVWWGVLGLGVAGLYLLRWVPVPRWRSLDVAALGLGVLGVLGWFLGWVYTPPFAYVPIAGFSLALFPFMHLAVARGDGRDGLAFFLLLGVGALMVGLAGLMGLVVLSNDRLLPLALTVYVWRVASLYGRRILWPLLLAGFAGMAVFGVFWINEARYAPVYSPCNGVAVSDIGSSYPLLWSAGGVWGSEAASLFLYQYPVMPALYLKTLGDAPLCLYGSGGGAGFLSRWRVNSTSELGWPGVEAGVGVLGDDLAAVYRVATMGVPYVVVHPADVYAGAATVYVGKTFFNMTVSCPGEVSLPPGYWLYIRAEGGGGVLLNATGVALPGLTLKCDSGVLRVEGLRALPRGGGGGARLLPGAAYFPVGNRTRGVYIDRFSQLAFREVSVAFLSGVVEEVNGSRVYIPVAGGRVEARRGWVEGGEFTYPRLVLEGAVFNGSYFERLVLLARLPNVTAGWVESGFYRGRGLTCYFMVYDVYYHCFDVGKDSLAYRNLRFAPPTLAELARYPQYVVVPEVAVLGYLLYRLGVRRDEWEDFSAVFISAAFIGWAVWRIVLSAPVQSGDDPAAHLYIAIKVAGGDLGQFWESQYPNLLHLLLAAVWLASRDPLLLAKVLQLLTAGMVAAGVALYLLYFWRALRSAFPVATLLMTVSAVGVLHTLVDGSVMELVFTMVGLPASLYLYWRGKPLLAGVVAGMSAALSYVSLVTALATLIPAFYKRLWRFLAGFILGGNIFLVKMALALGLAVARGALAGGGGASGPGPLQAFGVVLGYGYLPLYLVLGVAVLLHVLRTRGLGVSYSWLYHLAAAMTAFGFVNPDLGTRLSRVNPLVLALSVVHLPHLSRNLVRVGLLALALIYVVYGVVKLGDISILHRVDQATLSAYLEARELVRPNSVVLVVAQVSSWAMPFLQDPSRNVTVLRVATPDVYAAMDPNDPELRYGPKLYHELTAGRVPAGVDYILLQLPNRGQWYHESLAELARRLWKQDFSCSVVLRSENIKLLKCR